jgi:putative ABC transport system permease protein
MAIGARRGDILKLILGHGASLGLAGAILGSLMALGLTRFLNSQLYGVSNADPTTFLTAVFLLLLAVVVATYLPMRRAIAVDPVVAMRHE